MCCANRAQDPRKLVPALMRYNIANNPPGHKANQALRFLQHCVKNLDSRDAVTRFSVDAMRVSLHPKPDLSVQAVFICGGCRVHHGVTVGGWAQVVLNYLVTLLCQQDDEKAMVRSNAPRTEMLHAVL